MGIIQAIGRRWRNKTYFGKNYDAAKRDFLRILQSQNLTSELEQRTHLFTRGFERTYNAYQGILTRAVSVAKPRGYTKGVSEQVVKGLDMAVGYIEEYVREDDYSKIGAGFGILMAVAQYGIGSAYFDPEEYGTATLKECKNIEEVVHKIDGRLQLVNISSRLLKIEQETKRTLLYSPTTRMLYRMSEEFATSG